ncbi:MAG: alpha/beta fold hydrolase [Bdellovibrionales bacterium]|nr:alpha/beta fold hydrolase [Bdellovibrionales bacterium]
MSHSPIHVFFLRGLSTYGHDNAKWSVFDFGPIHKHLAAAFGKRDIHFVPVLGMGAGSLPEVAKRACEFIESHPLWLSSEPIHLLGHSAGGLVSRLVLRELEEKKTGKILSCLSVASPHAGAHLARVCLDMPQNYRGSTLVLRSFGYDIHSKRGFFDELVKENVVRLFTGHSYRADTASLVCWDARTRWCTPLKMFYTVRAFRDFDLPSDGVVERDTQAFGRVIAELNIDHFRQVGLFKDSKQSFEKMCDVIRDYFRTQQRLS